MLCTVAVTRLIGRIHNFEPFALTQEALEKLGYYSGEEDMEFSSFSSGTERAVKTWQVTASLFRSIQRIFSDS
jgi:hypothetical protein